MKFDERVIDLSTASTKTDSSKRNVPLLPELAEALQAHRKRRGSSGLHRIASDALIFTRANGEPLTRRLMLHAVNAAGKRAGLQPEGAEAIGCHDLRHSLAAYALGGGLDLRKTSRLLRHANPQVTATVYAGLTNAEVAGLGDALAAIGSAS